MALPADEDTPKRRMAENIKQAREAKGLTQQQVADTVGVSDQAVYLWESGTTSPKGANLDALSEVLGWSKSELRFGKGAPVVHAVREPDPERAGPRRATGAASHRVRVWLKEFELELAKAGATDEEISEARAVLTSPEVYTFFSGGQRQEFTEDQLLQGMRAIAHGIRLTLRDRGRKIEIRPDAS